MKSHFITESLQKWFPEIPAASKRIGDDPWMLSDALKIQYKVPWRQKNKRWTPGGFERLGIAMPALVGPSWREGVGKRKTKNEYFVKSSA